MSTDVLRQVIEALQKEGGLATVERLSYAYQISLTTLIGFFEDVEAGKVEGIKSLRRGEWRYLLLPHVTEDDIHRAVLDGRRRIERIRGER